MMQKIDHVGIAVLDLDKGIETYKGLGFEYLGRETVAEQGVEVAFFRLAKANLNCCARWVKTRRSASSSPRMGVKAACSRWPLPSTTLTPRWLA